MEAEDLEEYEERFNKCFAEIEHKIEILGNCAENEKETIIRQGDNVANELQQDINTYTAEIELLDHGEAKRHRAQLKIYEANYDNIFTLFNTAKCKARNLDEE